MTASRGTVVGPRRVADRPRDPGVEYGVLAAALDVYADHRWSRFAFDAARRASTGKAALYRRWRNKEELLPAAPGAHAMVVESIDTGTIHDDLLVVARGLFAVYLQGSAGLASLRFFVEARAHPDLLTKSWARVKHRAGASCAEYGPPGRGAR
ncbi:helix-turn-helix domain-containing protein [Streptomyces flaveolus]|uniref:helix-turn-helix domain-containing protein n=1 Tax=Streptomyces flaveolus TaxID=67297 RepID=UPI00382D9472